MELAKYNMLQLFDKTRQQFSKASCFNFSSRIWYVIILFFTCLMFWSRWYQINDRKQPSATVQKNSFSVGLQSGPFDHSPKEMYV